MQPDYNNGVNPAIVEKDLFLSNRDAEMKQINIILQQVGECVSNDANKINELREQTINSIRIWITFNKASGNALREDQEWAKILLELLLKMDAKIVSQSKLMDGVGQYISSVSNWNSTMCRVNARVNNGNRTEAINDMEAMRALGNAALGGLSKDWPDELAVTKDECRGDAIARQNIVTSKIVTVQAEMKKEAITRLNIMAQPNAQPKDKSRVLRVLRAVIAPKISDDELVKKAASAGGTIVKMLEQLKEKKDDKYQSLLVGIQKYIAALALADPRAKHADTRRILLSNAKDHLKNLKPDGAALQLMIENMATHDGGFSLISWIPKKGKQGYTSRLEALDTLLAANFSKDGYRIAKHKYKNWSGVEKYKKDMEANLEQAKLGLTA